MKLDIHQVDAFTNTLFSGNPAAICPLPYWLPDEILQNIAMENNLSETAYFVQKGERFQLRWFTPEAEVNLCGHATLGTAFVLFNHLGYENDEIIFDSKSGELKVRREGNLLKMNFPANQMEEAEVPPEFEEGLGVQPVECYKSTDYMLVLEDQEQIERIEPDMALLKKIKTRGIIVTAQGREVDFVSRFFAPSVGVDEDPVTGSAHTLMIPYWANRLNKKELTARQLSKRGGKLHCILVEDRVEIAGHAISYLTGTIHVPV